MASLLLLTRVTTVGCAGAAGPEARGFSVRTRSTGSTRTCFTGVKIGMRAETGMTPVDSSGTMTMTAATIVSTVKAVAMGQRLPLRAAGEDSSRVSPNIFFLTSDEEI